MKDIHWAIEHNRCRVNGRVERFASTKLAPRMCVSIHLEKRPRFCYEEKRVLAETPSWLVYDKPIGISSEKLSSLLQLHLVHRLDRDTSGVILFAKTPQAQRELEILFKNREIKKSYLALVEGTPPQKEGKIEKAVAKIGKREGAVKWGVVPSSKGVYACTEWILLKKIVSNSLLRCFPITGRTHQIRVHLSSIGLPIVGDVEYGKKEQDETLFRPLLHAESLTLAGKKIEAPLPPDLSI